MVSKLQRHELLPESEGKVGLRGRGAFVGESLPGGVRDRAKGSLTRQVCG